MSTNQRIPSLKALRTFQVAGRHLSFKAAADELFLSASAVSHQVKNLESALGLELFVRKTRALEFTEPGLRFFTVLDEIFARLEAETHQIRSEYGRNILRVCAPPFFTSEILLPRLVTLQGMMPKTDIRLITQSAEMKNHPGDTDLSILVGTDEWPELTTYPLFAKRILLACSPTLKNKLKLRSPEDLDGKTLLRHESNSHSWETWAKHMGIAPPTAGQVYRFDSMSAVAKAAVEGLGIAVVSLPLSKHLFDSGALVRAIDDDVVTDEMFYLAHRKNQNIGLNMRTLIDWIINECKNMDENISP